MKRIFGLLGALALVLASFLMSGGITATNPNATRFDDGPGSWGVTYSFTTTSDSVLWIGFVANNATVVRMNANVQVTPIFVSKTLQDDALSSRTVANPRAGMAAFSWGSDTLTTTLPRWDYCCQKKLIGIRIKGIGTAGYVKIYADNGNN